jgi:hypothetical protein
MQRRRSSFRFLPFTYQKSRPSKRAAFFAEPSGPCRFVIRIVRPPITLFKPGQGTRYNHGMSQRRIRFSLRELLWWVTLTCLTTAGLRALEPAVPLASVFGPILLAGLCAAVFTRSLPDERQPSQRPRRRRE